MVRPVVLGATARTVPPTVAAVAVVAVVPTFIVAVAGRHDFAGALSAASVIAGAGAGFAVDDPAAPTLASSPTTLATRRLLRAAFVVAVLFTAWAAALLVAVRYGDRSPDAAALAAELCASAAVAAAVASRARTDAPISVGAGAAGVALLTIVTISAFAYLTTALPSLGREFLHTRWWWLAAAGIAFAGWSSRDPATRSRRRPTARARAS